MALALIDEALYHVAKSRILVLDGAMGTMIQAHDFQENDYRGERFADWHSDVKGIKDGFDHNQINAPFD